MQTNMVKTFFFVKRISKRIKKSLALWQGEHSKDYFPHVHGRRSKIWTKVIFALLLPYLYGYEKHLYKKKQTVHKRGKDSKPKFTVKAETKNKTVHKRGKEPKQKRTKKAKTMKKGLTTHEQIQKQ